MFRKNQQQQRVQKMKEKINNDNVLTRVADQGRIDTNLDPTIKKNIDPDPAVKK